MYASMYVCEGERREEGCFSVLLLIAHLGVFKVWLGCLVFARFVCLLASGYLDT